MGSPLKVFDISYYDLQSCKVYIEYMFGWKAAKRG
jgi:hypothetical protein